MYYAYDELGRLLNLKHDADQVAYYVYDALGRWGQGATPTLDWRKRQEPAQPQWCRPTQQGARPDRVKHGSGTNSYYAYDAGSRLTSLYHRTSTDEVIASFDYQHDAVGNPTRMGLANGDTCYYGYDAVYQLTSEVRLDSGDGEVYTQYFTYDPTGNRTTLEPSGSIGTEHVSYDYNAADELTCEYTATAATYYAYDANGNTIAKDDGEAVAYYAYDSENRFTSYQKTSDTVYYTYDPDGRRIGRFAGGTTEKWLFDELDSVVQYDGADAVQWQHVLAGLDQIVRRYADTSAYDYLTDHLGSTRATKTTPPA